MNNCSAPGLLSLYSQNYLYGRSGMIHSVAVSLALAAITAVAAYYCITAGMNVLSRVNSALSLDARVLALCDFSILTCMGTALGLVAAANVAFAIFGRPITQKQQLVGSVGAPLALLVLLLYVRSFFIIA